MPRFGSTGQEWLGKLTLPPGMRLGTPGKYWRQIVRTPTTSRARSLAITAFAVLTMLALPVATAGNYFDVLSGTTQVSDVISYLGGSDETHFGERGEQTWIYTRKLEIEPIAGRQGSARVSWEQKARLPEQYLAIVFDANGQVESVEWHKANRANKNPG